MRVMIYVVILIVLVRCQSPISPGYLYLLKHIKKTDFIDFRVRLAGQAGQSGVPINFL